MRRYKWLLPLGVFFVLPSVSNAQTEKFVKNMDLSPRFSSYYNEMSGGFASEGIQEFVMGNAGMELRPEYTGNVEILKKELNYPNENNNEFPSQFFIRDAYNYTTGEREVVTSLAPFLFKEDSKNKHEIGLDFGFYKDNDVSDSKLLLHENRSDMNFGYSFGNYYDRFKVKIDVQKISGSNINIAMDDVSEDNKKKYDINDNKRQILEFNVDKMDTPTLVINSKTKDTAVARIKYISVYGLKDENKVSSITMTPETCTIKVDKTKLLYHKVTPETAINKKVSYKSSDPSTVRVFSSGKVKGLKPGIATITATTEDGGYTAQSVITVE